MTSYVVSSGIVSSGVVLQLGDAEHVLSGGLAEVTEVRSGGREYVQSGAGSLFDHVSAGGVLTANRGARISDVTVSSGGMLDGAGTLVDDTNIDDGVVSGLQVDGALFVGSGGRVLGGVVEGAVTVEAGGTAENTVVSSGGALSLSLDATAEGVMISSGGRVDLSTTVSAGQVITIGSSSGPAETNLDGVTVEQGGILNLEQATLLSGGTLSLTTGTSIDHILISAGGSLIGSGTVSSIISAIDYGVISGVQLDNGASSNPFEIRSGGDADDIREDFFDFSIYRGGVVSGIAASDSQISTSGMIYNAELSNSELKIFRGGVGSSIVLDDQSTALVESGGRASALVLQAGFPSSTGDEVESAGSTVSTLISSGRYELNDVGAHSTGTIVLDGGLQTVHGVALRTTVSSGGEESVLGSSAIAENCVVLSGGLLSIDNLASASKDVVSSGGILQLGAVVVSSGTTITVGPAAAHTTVDGVTVLSGATVSYESAAVLSGGKAIVTSGASVADFTTLRGGILVDDGSVTLHEGDMLGGTLSGSGVIEIEGNVGRPVIKVGIASTFTGQVDIDSSAVLELTSPGALGRGSIAFTSAFALEGLQIGAPSQPVSSGTFANTLMDFDSPYDQIDLAGVAFTSGATANVHGTTLTLTDGGYVASFNLSGTVATHYQVTSDYQSGTYIMPVASGADALTQAAASFGASPAAVTPLGGHEVQSATVDLTAETAARGGHRLG